VSDEFKDNSEEYEYLLVQAIRHGLRAIGMAAETYAKETCPVDTGYARNSITYALSGETADISSYKADTGKNGEPPKTGKYSGTMGNTEDKYVVIGSNVEYFPFIEEGARGRKAYHTLRKAATDHKDEYKQLLTDSIKNA
jgi:hypothetical protein